MEDLHLHDDLSYAAQIHIAGRHVKAAAARLLAPYDITPNQACLLYFVAHGETMPSRIASQMGVDVSSLSRMIGNLEARGLLDREPDVGNRTRTVLRLTPAGRALDRKIAWHADAIQSMIHDALSENDRRALARALRKIADAAREMPGPDASESRP